MEIKKIFEIILVTLILLFLPACMENPPPDDSALETIIAYSDGGDGDIPTLADYNQLNYNHSQIIVGANLDQINRFIHKKKFENTKELFVLLDLLSNNHAPTADAGVDTSIILGETITLNGLDSDDDGQIERREWKYDNSILSSSATVDYTPTELGAYIFTYTVVDNLEKIVSDTVTITVTGKVNIPPVVDAGSNQNVEYGTSVTLTGTATDRDGQIVESHWEGWEGETQEQNYLFTANYIGTKTFTFTATDNNGSTVSDEVNVTVSRATNSIVQPITTPTNKRPTADAQEINIKEDTPIDIILTGKDPEHDALSYIIVSNPTHGTILGTIPHITYRPNNDYAGDDHISFKVNDGHTDSTVVQISISIEEASEPNYKRTKQVVSYNTTGTAVTNGTEKDDGLYQKGVEPSYTKDDNLAGVVIDNITGLVWQDNAEPITKKWLSDEMFGQCQEGNTTACSYAYHGDTVLNYCNDLNEILDGEGAYSMWRIPSINELKSIIKYGLDTPAIDGIFTHTAPQYYWSNDTTNEDKSIAWSAYFGRGHIETYDKNTTHFIRCVATHYAE